MKKTFTAVVLLVFLAAACYAVVNLAMMPPTYQGSSVDAAALLANPENYDVANADGVASIMVKETLAETHAVNVVTAVLFDFRGYDTMGEAFILLTAISGCLVVLRKSKQKGTDLDE